MNERVGILQHHLDRVIKPCAKIKPPQRRDWCYERAVNSSLRLADQNGQVEPQYRFLQTEDGKLAYVQMLLGLTESFLQHNYYVIPDLDYKTGKRNHNDHICLEVCDNLEVNGQSCRLDGLVYTSSWGWVITSLR